ncbi:putative T7SS-secreted protein [Paractinoplanes atraurantiacus]|uniref:Toxin 28 n=1 Tax=Paractinoplanes atraurantiacus TaxID=1036182 RepID=A0A285F082_9ACTN|nr:polymorphic toxin type 28 domain-containing protein [Actinoplanes atraurantiacus]SNY04720.1 toxin 28 [Actinoplanes atraurantiacus]
MTELGQTRDPLALVPGDPAAVEGNVRALRDRAANAEKAGDGLVDIDTGAWTGEAGDAFREKFSYEPNKWYEASNSLATAADGLAVYAGTLRWAQGQAAEAIRLWDEGEAASARARQAYDQQVAQAVPGQVVAPFVDSGEAGRQAARDTLKNARDQVVQDGDAAARFLNAEADAAPEESSWLDAVGDFALDVGADVVNGLASFGNAMIQHPGETAALAGGLLLTAVSAGGEGVGFALDATGVGAVAGVPLNVVSAAGITTGVAITGAATTSLMQHAAGEDAVSPMSGSQPSRSVPSKTDRMKEHLTDRDLDAARRELNGEVVARKPSGQPWDHVDEVRNAQRGLTRRIDQLKRLLGDSRTTEAERAAYQSELSEASRLLDHSEQFVPRL